MIDSPYMEDQFFRVPHRPTAPWGQAGSPLVVDLPTIMEMISLLSQGHVSGQQLQQALDIFARRFGTPAEASGRYSDTQGGYPGAPNDYANAGMVDSATGHPGAASTYAAAQARYPSAPHGSTDTVPGHPGPARGYADTVSGYAYPPGGQPERPGDDRYAQDAVGEGCPHGCPVCADARAEFDAIAAESFTHKVRLSDPEHYPYAAGRHTLHLSNCPKVARFVGRVEPIGSPFCLAGLPSFAHHGVFSTAWAAGMQVMTADEAAEWVRGHGDPYDGAGYKACAHCLPPAPGPEASTDNSFDVGYWSAEDVVTW
ncbi:hypothetical protein [Streptomyces sp. NBC_01198]|uniref:hypothetical protein n=1 Tax=Streptomyces sp. NBC_01198 TaxID=2903769 RepID=UPI002E157CB2|nr:hypothetical protein OG702_05195 [Streptomyces sp. NBC_01198]